MSYCKNGINRNFFWVKLFMHGLYRRIFTKTPIYLTFFVTSRCNAKCKHCLYQHKLNSDEKNELSLEEIKKISLSMDRIDELLLTGGEPFLRKDLSEIAYLFYKNNKAQIIRIPTNAYFTKIVYNETKKILKKCEKSLVLIQLSVDGVYKNHDKIRGIDNSFNNLIKTYNKLYGLQKEYSNLIIDFSFTFSKENQDYALETYNFIKNNLKFNNFGLTLIRGDVNNRLKDISMAKYKGIVNQIINSKNENIKGFGCLFHWLIKKRRKIFFDTICNTYITKKRQLNCTAGTYNAIIDEEGNVYPCELINRNMGSLRDNNYDFKKVWFNEEAQKIRKFIEKGKCYCTCEPYISISLNFSLKWFKMFF